MPDGAERGLEPILTLWFTKPRLGIHRDPPAPSGSPQNQSWAGMAPNKSWTGIAPKSVLDWDCFKLSHGLGWPQNQSWTGMALNSVSSGLGLYQTQS